MKDRKWNLVDFLFSSLMMQSYDLNKCTYYSESRINTDIMCELNMFIPEHNDKRPYLYNILIK